MNSLLHVDVESFMPVHRKQKKNIYITLKKKRRKKGKTPTLLFTDVRAGLFGRKKVGEWLFKLATAFYKNISFFTVVHLSPKTRTRISFKNE